MWVKITCTEREALVDEKGRSYNGFSSESGIGPISSKTDPDGIYGRPHVCTEWGYSDGALVLRDERWPKSDTPCEHHKWVHGNTSGYESADSPGGKATP